MEQCENIFPVKLVYDYRKPDLTEKGSGVKTRAQL